MGGNPTGEVWVRLINAFTEGLADAHGFDVGERKRKQCAAWLGSRWRSSSKKRRAKGRP